VAGVGERAGHEDGGQRDADLHRPRSTPVPRGGAITSEGVVETPSETELHALAVGQVLSIQV
jgi:hypothetical protein